MALAHLICCLCLALTSAILHRKEGPARMWDEVIAAALATAALCYVYSIKSLFSVPGVCCTEETRG